MGIDIGSSKAVIVSDDADLVRTATGGISRASMVGFYGSTRLVGEEAAPQVNSGDILVQLNRFLDGKSIDELSTSALHAHRKSKFSMDASNRLCVDVTYMDEAKTISYTALLALYLKAQVARIDDVHPQKVNLAFVLPPNASMTSSRTLRDACTIAGVDLARCCTVNKADALTASYERKLTGLPIETRTAMYNKHTVIIEVGHSQTTILAVKVNKIEDEKERKKRIEMGEVEGATTEEFGVKLLSTVFDDELGSLHYDMKMFDKFAADVKSKTGSDVTPGTKRGFRLLTGCEKLRKLLSQLPDSSIMVENISDNGDMNFKLTRDELKELSTELLVSFKDNLLKACSDAGIAASDVSYVEILGGGVRMQVLQSIVSELFGASTNNVMGAKLDDGSCALGATLVANTKYIEGYVDEGSSPFITYGMNGELCNLDTIGFSAEELTSMISEEAEMSKKDEEIAKLVEKRNEMEGFLLESRGISRREFGELVDANALDELLNEYENWMWDFPDADYSELDSKFQELSGKVNELAKAFMDATDAKKKAEEAEMEKEAEKARIEKELSGEDDDHDNRKLKKADRMRLVIKNKEEGTEIFKGGVYRTAAARYAKALTHCTKFFDLDPKGEAEVNELKVTLYLNLAMCYLKMDQPDNALNQCNFALQLDPKNAKAFFRRSQAYEGKKDIEAALSDAETARSEMVVQDKGVNDAIKRLKKKMAEEKKKEKAMWGKAFK